MPWEFWFGRRINENASAGTASVMMVMGGGVRGGIYGTAPRPAVTRSTQRENNGSDVRYETDFRAVWALSAGWRLRSCIRGGISGLSQF